MILLLILILILILISYIGLILIGLILISCIEIHEAFQLLSSGIKQRDAAPWRKLKISKILNIEISQGMIT